MKAPADPFTLSSLAEPLVSHCPLCSSQKLKRKVAYYKSCFFSQCRECGFVFQDPQQSAESSRVFYEKDYYEDFKALEDRIREARKPLYSDVLKQVEPYRQCNRILDVGSGFGDFLRVAKRAGWEPWGLEPSLEACVESQKDLGSTIICGTSDEAKFEDSFFDVITLWNVLDCVADPKGSVEKFRQWLRPGGCLFIRTPNTSVHLRLHQIYKVLSPVRKKLGWEQDTAVFLRSNFSASSLRHFIGEAGFEIESLSNAMPTSGDPYRVMSKGQWMDFFKKSFLLTARGLAFISGGRWLCGTTLLVFARKKEAIGMKPGEHFNEPIRRAAATRIFLKSIFLHVLAIMGYLVGLPFWCRFFIKKENAAVFLYHSITEGPPGEMSVSAEAFRKQMRFLKDNFNVVSLDSALGGLSSDKKPVAITFDDGYEDNYQIAFPVLKQCQLPATIFLLTGNEGEGRKTGHLGKVQDYYPGQLLSWGQIREMSQKGISFGSHGESHQRLGSLGTMELTNEVIRSKEQIEKETGQPVHFFSYPYGTFQDFDSRTVELVRESGYRAAFSAVYGTVGTDLDRFAIRRMNVDSADTLFTLRAKLNGALATLQIFHWKPLRTAIRAVDRVFSLIVMQKNSLFLPVLLASVDFPPHTDGVSTIAGELARKISARRPEVYILGPSDQGDRAMDRQSHYQAVRVPGYDWGYARMLPFAPAMIWLILTKGIRRVYALNIAYGGVIAWLLSYPFKLKYVLFAYGYEFEKVRSSAFVKKWYQTMYERSEKVICCSEEVRKRLLDFGVSEEKAELIYPAVDLNRYQPGIPQAYFVEQHALAGKRIILTVGRLVERKGHDQVLRALKSLTGKYPEILYCISGKGGFESRLKELVSELGLEKHVRFMGRVSDDELRDLYNLCEFFIMPSREIESNGHIEGFGIVFLEANAFGKPVIGGQSGGVAEAVQDGVSGLLADPNSPEDIALKMETLLSKPDYAKQLGQQGLERLRNRFHWDGYVRRAYTLLMGEELP